jgi:hypothetical protein
MPTPKQQKALESMAKTHSHLTGLLCALAGLGQLFLTPASALAAEDSEDEKWEFVWNTVIHIMHHEIGHALVDQFALPVIGQEEDAADGYATLAVLETYEEPQPVLLDAAAAWFAMHDQAVDTGQEPYYFGEHDLDIQRAYRIICYAHGYDPDTFDAAAKDVELPEDRLESCAADSAQVLESWDALLADTYRIDDGPGGQVTVELAGTRRFDDIRTALEDHGLMQDIGDWLDETYDWPAPLLVAADECGEPNAFYSADDVQVTLCYEFITYLRDLADEVIE